MANPQLGTSSVDVLDGVEQHLGEKAEKAEPDELFRPVAERGERVEFLRADEGLLRVRHGEEEIGRLLRRLHQEGGRAVRSAGEEKGGEIIIVISRPGGEIEGASFRACTWPGSPRRGRALPEARTLTPPLEPKRCLSSISVGLPEARAPTGRGRRRAGRSCERGRRRRNRTFPPVKMNDLFYFQGLAVGVFELELPFFAVLEVQAIPEVR